MGSKNKKKQKINWREVAKDVARFVAGASVQVVVKNMISASTPEDLEGLENVLVKLGTFLMANVIVENQITTWIDQAVDDFGKKKEEKDEEEKGSEEGTTGT